MGGQTALNCALDLVREGVLDECGVELIAASQKAIDMAEDREQFREAMSEINLESPKAEIAHSLDEAIKKQKVVGYPTIIRPSFTLGGLGGGIARTKKDFFKYFLTPFLIFTLLSCNESKNSNPNIIYILADDLGYGDLSSFGALDIKTPNIDFIAQNGIKFTDFYSVSSVCTPSRAGMLTGRYPQRFGLNGVLFPDSHTGMPSSEYTIAELLRDNGYRTGIVGKWHLGHKYDFLPLQQGFDFFFGRLYSSCLLYTSPSPRDATLSRMPSSA